MIKKIKEFIKKDKVERAIKTFIEAFVSYIAINIMATDISNIDTIKGLLIGALASAISVLINSIKTKTNEIEDDEDW